jgi:hypothetical protein
MSHRLTLPLTLPVTLAIGDSRIELGEIQLDPRNTSEFPALVAEMLHAVADGLALVDPDEDDDQDDDEDQEVSTDAAARE